MLPKILRSLSPIACVAAAFTLFAPAPLVAQAASSLVTTRLTQPIDDAARVTLKGNVHPLARAANDRGAAPDSMPLDRIQVVFKRSDAQESALKQLITDMHTPGSASYHKWLTPDQFGKQFGPSDQDIATIEAWLQSKGFSITKLNPGKQTLEISGNVAQLRTAFHTQIHKYTVNGETHYANATDPQIPSALASVFGGFASLNNFRPKSQSKILGHALWDAKTHQATPEWTYPVGTGENFAIAPGDFAVQYDVPNSSLNPSYSGTTYDGTGQTIAIVNESNINIGAVNAFRSTFGLPANPPQVIIDGNDPGVDGINNPDGPNGASGEAYLDVEWSGAVAPRATVDLVIAADTAIESGLFLAMEHAVYGNIAPVISLSFLGCEQNQGTSGNAFINNLWEQAAAQGITVMVSAGDGGSAGCDNFDSQQYAVGGLAVNGLSSTPYNVSVGGTDFYYSDYQNSTALNTQLSTYWNRNATNTPTTSLLTRIPEQPWNDSQYGLDVINYYTLTGGTTIAGGSGGASVVYTKPAWQTGTGVPTANSRYMPDVSLFAADGANYSYYAFCGGSDGDCQGSVSGNPVQISGAGGTSISSPAFAGIMALVNQKYGRQGQANFVLYPMATQYPAAFHDVTVGNNSVPCNINTTSFGQPPLDCIAVSNPVTVDDSTYGTATEGQMGTGTTPAYNSTAGYDLASGLGSVDASVLIGDWSKVTFKSTTTTLTPSQSSFTHGTSITISGSVSGTGTPTGNVALMTDSTEPVQQGQGFPQIFNGTSGTFTLSSGSFSGPVNYLPGGTYNIWGQYSGDPTNAASSSQKTQLTVSPESSGIYFNLFSPAGTSSSGSIVSGASIDYGTQILLSAQVAPSSQLTALENCFTTSAACPVFGIPTGTIAFLDGSTTINTAVLNAEGDAEYNAPFSVGSHSLSAKYAGDNSYNAATTTATTFTVVKDTPVFNVSAANQDSNGDYIGSQPTVFNIQVANAAQIDSATTQAFPSPVAPPTGTITLSGAPSGVPTSATLVPGVVSGYQAVQGIATITAPASTPAGNYNVTINYSGDANYNATSGQGTISIVSVSGGLASTTAATATGSISPTTSIAITGTVTGQSGHAAPTGDILVYSSGSYITEIGITPGSGDSSTYSLVLNSQNLFQGANFITLQYTGDNTYYPSAFQLSSAVLSPLSDFSIVPETTIVPVKAGGSSTDTVNLYSINGFSGAVSFTCTGTTVTCSISTSASLSSGSSSPLTLTVDAGSSVATGNYNMLVTGVDSTGKFVHTLGIQAAVTGATTPSFSLSANPTTLGLVAGATTGNTSVISVTPSNSFTGTVDLTCAVTPPSGTITSPATCSLNPTSPDVTSGAVTSTLTVDSTATTTAGSYTVTVTGKSGTITETTTVTVTITAPATPTFTLSAAPTTLSLVAGATSGNTSTISVTPSNGFTGNVPLSCAVTGPSGATSPATCSLSPTTADITGAAAVTSTLTVATMTTTTPGTYKVTTTGTLGTVTSTAPVTVTVTAAPVPGFTLSANPTTLSPVAGVATGNTSTISVKPSNSFTGNVTLSYTVSGPSGATSSPTVTFATNPVDITGAAAGTSVATVATTVTTTPGSYTITVTGTSGTLTSTTTVTVTVTAPPTPTFTVSANPTSGSITAGSSATSTISVTPANGFTGDVALTCGVAGSGSGVSCSLSPASVTISGATAATSTLTITTSSNSAFLSRPLNKLFAIGGGATLAMLFFFGIPARRRSWRAVLGVLIFAAIVGMGIGCGSSGSNNNSANYTVTVTGTAGSIVQTATVSITVTSH